ncbi:hypothetical protein Sjap_021982 [Stephania japonica]|uniref:Pectinesterase n=1 Tax=Stephania japonica TaxID=461633 RepID=A0AAP0EQL6_9MAGN
MNNSPFKGYSKVNEAEEIAFRKKTRRRLLVIALSTILLVGIVGAIVGTVIHKSNNNNNKNNGSSSSTNGTNNWSPNSIIKAICTETNYPDTCFSSLSSFSTNSSSSSNNKFDLPEELFKYSLQVALNELSTISSLPDNFINRTNVNDTRLIVALKDCKTLFGDAIDELNDSIASAHHDSWLNNIDDIRIWLNAVLTDLETCLDGLDEMSSNNNVLLLSEMRTCLQNSTMYTSNSLAIVTNIVGLVDKFSVIPMQHRKLLSSDGGDYPDWVNERDMRRLLDQNASAVMKADLTVAQDGTGTHTTIQDAVNAVTKKKQTRTVIYVKAGVYFENVIVAKEHWNIVMYGDGSTNTTVSGSLNYADGASTFKCGTFQVNGKGFVARDIGFKNTAGPEKHQAVALRSSADLSVFYRCAFDAYQDTLYTHKNRQFYRDCFITGTVDFIFGNAAVVFQNCSIQPRQPLPNQYNTITAQGKIDKDNATGISIHRCTITANGQVTARTYLGRPWKNFSTTVIMGSMIDGMVDPAGWIAWSQNTEPPTTIYYAEYNNSGPGAALDDRVKWAGYRPAMSDEKAHTFTVDPFFKGSRWIPHAIVPFDTSL